MILNTGINRCPVLVVLLDTSRASACGLRDTQEVLAPAVQQQTVRVTPRQTADRRKKLPAAAGWMAALLDHSVKMIREHAVGAASGNTMDTWAHPTYVLGPRSARRRQDDVTIVSRPKAPRRRHRRFRERCNRRGGASAKPRDPRNRTLQSVRSSPGSKRLEHSNPPMAYRAAVGYYSSPHVGSGSRRSTGPREETTLLGGAGVLSIASKPADSHEVNVSVGKRLFPPR